MNTEKIISGIITIVVTGVLALFGVSVMENGYKVKSEGDDFTLERDRD